MLEMLVLAMLLMITSWVNGIVALFFKLKVHCTLGCSYVLLFGFLSICININVRVRNLIKICKYSIEEVTFSCTLIHKRSLQQVAPIGNVIAPSLKVLVNYTRVACQMDEQCLKLPPLITGIIICVTFYTEHSHPHPTVTGQVCGDEKVPSASLQVSFSLFT